LCKAPIYGEKVHILIIFLQNKVLIAPTNIRVQHLTSGKNLSIFQSVQEILSVAFVLPEKRSNRDTKLIAIITLTALEEKNIFRIGRSREYGIYFLSPSRQYNAELPSQNRS